jgi:hypothetical protein
LLTTGRQLTRLAAAVNLSDHFSRKILAILWQILDFSQCLSASDRGAVRRAFSLASAMLFPKHNEKTPRGRVVSNRCFFISCKSVEPSSWDIKGCDGGIKAIEKRTQPVSSQPELEHERK